MTSRPLGCHTKTVLQCSGGLDSLACLYLLRPRWDELTVMWVNAGAAFPETLQQMAEIRELVPHFIEVRSNQPANIAQYGFPSDLLAAWDMPDGRIADDARTRRMQSPMTCCAANLWLPAMHATNLQGATLVIRGQRAEEAKKSPLRSGAVVDGIEYWFPIEDWSRSEVRTYLTREGVPIPAHYDYVDSSLDCMTCTAYVGENVGKFEYMKLRHPDAYRDVRRTIAEIIEAAASELSTYQQIMDMERTS
jgi:3'-phosphoadenosine 5'-phosphosulfate sulfotransferase (PAPS reductase)/FAD synthetase